MAPDPNLCRIGDRLDLVQKRAYRGSPEDYTRHDRDTYGIAAIAQNEALLPLSDVQSWFPCPRQLNGRFSLTVVSARPAWPEFPAIQADSVGGVFSRRGRETRPARHWVNRPGAPQG